jgi:hypothetical protein
VLEVVRRKKSDEKRRRHPWLENTEEDLIDVGSSLKYLIIELI